jgi:hypothetical protein
MRLIGHLHMPVDERTSVPAVDWLVAQAAEAVNTVYAFESTMRLR